MVLYYLRVVPVYFMWMLFAALSVIGTAAIVIVTVALIDSDEPIAIMTIVTWGCITVWYVIDGVRLHLLNISGWAARLLEKKNGQ